MTSLYNAIGDSSKVAVTDSSGSVSSGSPTGYWLLSMDLRINEDSLLEVHGTSSGGDCDYLRIKSDGSSDFYEIRGHGGSLSFKGTKVLCCGAQHILISFFPRFSSFSRVAQTTIN